jgi:hypothetical protein
VRYAKALQDDRRVAPAGRGKEGLAMDTVVILDDIAHLKVCICGDDQGRVFVVAHQDIPRDGSAQASDVRVVLVERPCVRVTTPQGHDVALKHASVFIERDIYKLHCGFDPTTRTWYVRRPARAFLTDVIDPYLLDDPE